VFEEVRPVDIEAWKDRMKGVRDLYESGDPDAAIKAALAVAEEVRAAKTARDWHEEQALASAASFAETEEDFARGFDLNEKLVALTRERLAAYRRAYASALDFSVHCRWKAGEKDDARRRAPEAIAAYEAILEQKPRDKEALERLRAFVAAGTKRPG
jgi:hypothetical protein